MAEIVRGATSTSASPWTVETVKELFDRLLEAVHGTIREHDRRYEERFRAQELAVKSAFMAAETAAAKLESNQAHTNAQQNEWRKTVQDFKDATVSRDAFDVAMKSLEDKTARNVEDIQRIEQRLASGSGGVEALADRRRNSNWLIGLLVVVGLNFVGMVVTLLMAWKG